MDLPIGEPRMLLADKGYDGDAVRVGLLLRAILPVIPPRSSRVEPPSYSFRYYRAETASSGCSIASNSSAA
nr:hypothetical protein [Pleomorphomonas koreensis]